MNTYITSDLHLGHTKIIKVCNRPYSTCEDMNNDFIAKINALPDNSILYHLGDFSLGGVNQVTNFLSFIKLSIRLRFIVGNHDKNGLQLLGTKISNFPNIESISNYSDINHKGQRIILFHYPILEWQGYFRNSIHLHGHCHGNAAYPPNLHRIADVSIDCSNYEIKPIEYWINKLTHPIE